MSNQPNSEVRSRKPYTPPTVTQLNPTNDPSPSLLEKLRLSLNQLDFILRVNPNDSAAAELQQSLRRALAEQESRQPTTAR